jgi:hypothetical protein
MFMAGFPLMAAERNKVLVQGKVKVCDGCAAATM